MDSIIVYQNDEGCLSFVYPANCNLTVEQIASKDVPDGKPFLIVSSQNIPTDHTFFNAFEADFSNPDGYGIGAEKWFANNNNGDNK